MRPQSLNEQQSTGETCPSCDQEVILVVAEAGIDLVECDCGRAAILSAA